MIEINGKPVIPEFFPAGEQRLRFAVTPDTQYSVTWRYEREEELITLFYLAKHIRGQGGELAMLYVPYLPNARMDRVKSGEEVFTLKYFCEFVNSLGFGKIVINNPHSDVCMALLNNAEDGYFSSEKRQHNNALIDALMKRLNLDSGRDVLFYPDQGCAKKYEGVIRFPFLTGHKKRDWGTGKIQSLDISGVIPPAPFNVLIVDDICSYGGTFLHAARKLKELGAGKIWLYVTHCENSLLKGELVQSGLIEKIYTTRSIFTAEAPEILEILEERNA
ncbi:MAG: hypothetical protein LBG78_02750 [Azoarcus sp.]|jgi:ribose-phosphate pyrophosphokinase|nr:hypothetical protein [Azoarcus sp.]